MQTQKSQKTKYLSKDNGTIAVVLKLFNRRDYYLDKAINCNWWRFIAQRRYCLYNNSCDSSAKRILKTEEPEVYASIY